MKIYHPKSFHQSNTLIQCTSTLYPYLTSSNICDLRLVNLDEKELYKFHEVIKKDKRANRFKKIKMALDFNNINALDSFMKDLAACQPDLETFSIRGMTHASSFIHLKNTNIHTLNLYPSQVIDDGKEEVIFSENLTALVLSEGSAWWDQESLLNTFFKRFPKPSNRKKIKLQGGSITRDAFTEFMKNISTNHPKLEKLTLHGSEDFLADSLYLSSLLTNLQNTKLHTLKLLACDMRVDDYQNITESLKGLPLTHLSFVNCNLEISPQDFVQPFVKKEKGIKKLTLKDSYFYGKKRLAILRLLVESGSCLKEFDLRAPVDYRMKNKYIEESKKLTEGKALTVLLDNIDPDERELASDSDSESGSEKEGSLGGSGENISPPST